MKKWKVKEIDSGLVKALTEQSDISAFIAKLLVGRGVVNTASAKEFFDGTPISDPFDIRDMDKAVNTITAAAENGDKILVYGDYDCDGITATVMLYSYLETIGADVSWRIPTRDEGYGLNIQAIEQAAEDGVKLIVTVDNGISAVDEAERIYELGMSLVVTDHHQVPDLLPRAEAVVNPHRRDDTSSFKYLAGCGVALKLIMAMENDIDSVCEQYCDLVTIGTVGDVVPLVGENRTIVTRGLDLLPYSENYGLNSLIKASGCDSENMTASGIAYRICPRINAAGRYETPVPAAELLLCEDSAAADCLAQKLCEMNECRRRIENEIFEQAIEQLDSNPMLLNRRIIIVSGEGWSRGIIGIVASRLVTEFGKPCIVISIDGDTACGSSRSKEQVSLFQLLDSCNELLVHFGGHANAAGFTVETSRLDELKARIYEYTERLPAYPAEILCADMEIQTEDMTLENIELLNRLQPFGERNPVPVFLMRGCSITNVRPLKDGRYVSFDFVRNGKNFRAFSFRVSYGNFGYKAGDTVDIMAEIDINEFNGKKSLQIRFADIRFSNIAQDKFFAAQQTYEELQCGKAADARLLKRIIPRHEDMKKVYDILRTTDSVSQATQRALAAGLNYCMFRVVLDVFSEFGLVRTELARGTVKLIPSGSKADLTKSKYLDRLTKMCGAE